MFRNFRLKKKIAISFGALIAMIALNALVAVASAYAIVGQMAHKQGVAEIFSEVDKVRLLVSRYVNTRSRASVQQIFQGLESIRERVHTARDVWHDDELRNMQVLLDDFHLNFQKFMAETDQAAALRIHEATLGQRMLAQLEDARHGPGALTPQMAGTLRTNLLEILWIGQGLQSGALLAPAQEMDRLLEALTSLRAFSQQPQASAPRRLMLFRVVRNATDYVDKLTSFLGYLERNRQTEQKLMELSDTLQKTSLSVSSGVEQAISRRLNLTMGLMATMFALTLLSALALSRYLSREILRPVRALVDAANQISQGNLQTRASVLVHDEIGELAVSFNAMTQNLLDKNTALAQAREQLEHRVQERTLQLAARELLVRQIMDTAPIAVFLVDMDGRITQANQSMVEMFGYSMQELLGKEYVALVDAAELEVRRAKMLALMNSEIPLVDLDRKFVRANGQEFWAHLTAKLFLDSMGNKQGLVGVIADISERKKEQEKLQLAANVFGYAREGIIISDARGSIIDVNGSFTRITGYSREEVVGQNPRLLSSGRQDKAFYAAMWQRLAEVGHWSGEVWNRRKSGEVFAELLTISSVRDAAGTVLQYVALFSDITAIKEHQSKLEHFAHFDALTALPNRVLLADRLQQAMAHAQRRGRQLAVAYLDLDGFKAINDTHGHDAGDQVLVALATHLKQVLREGDTLARLGGDEFVAVLIDLEETAVSAPLLTRLLAAAAKPVQLGVHTLQVSCSLGVTFYPQAQEMDADQLLRQADQAMYQAKVAGKNCYRVFDAVQDNNLRGHHENLGRIRLALEQDEFVLHYQPQVNMRTGQVVGVEALIRWQHPEKGLLPPAAFLPVIEEHPLAVTVGEWVIDQALTQMGEWHAAGLKMPVSVNIGARQLQQSDFVARLKAILARHPQVNPANLGLEVLETSALADMEQVSHVIDDCANIGILFALDDFGTGYSSLTYLKLLHVALLKIDQSFVRDMLSDPDDLAILQGVIGLAAAFKRDVIAEGVETVAHGTALLHLGCELAQGYGIARPMPADQLPSWVATWEPDAAWCDLPWLGGNLPSTEE